MPGNDEFTDDTVDSGDLGVGHFVTSFYELERDLNLSDRRMATVRCATQGEDNLRKEFYGLVVQGSQLSH